MSLKRTGLRSTARKAPDGSILRVDYYDRRTNQFLGNDRAAAIAKAGFAEPAPKRVTTFGELCAAYLASPDFAKLAPATQTLNRLYVDSLRERLGAFSAGAITRPAVRRLRDAYAQQPTKGNRMIATLRRVLAYGMEIGTLKENAASRPGRLVEQPRDTLWADDQIERFLAAAPPALRRALALMLFTVQRPADVLTMGAHHVTQRNGRSWIMLRQAKTGELIDVPLHARAAAILAEPLPPPSSRRAAAIVGADFLVPSPTGRPWAYRNFCRAWDAVEARADYRLARAVIATWPPPRLRNDTEARKQALRGQLLGGLQRRDFRRTGMVKMAQAGATPSQIAAVSGHSIDSVMRILDTYIPRRSEVALGAITAWESGADRGQVINLAGGRRGTRNRKVASV